MDVGGCMSGKGTEMSKVNVVQFWIIHLFNDIPQGCTRFCSKLYIQQSKIFHTEVLERWRTGQQYSSISREMLLVWLISLVELKFTIWNQEKQYLATRFSPTKWFSFILLLHCSANKTDRFAPKLTPGKVSFNFQLACAASSVMRMLIPREVLRLLINICYKSQIRSNLLSTLDKTNLNTGRSTTRQTEAKSLCQLYVIMWKTAMNCSLHFWYDVAYNC